MEKLVLIGGGGHCKSVLDSAIRSMKYKEIVIIDPSLPVGTSILGCSVVGNDSILPDLITDGFTSAFITVGSITETEIRKRLMTTIGTLGFELATIIDPSAIISEYSTIEGGTFVGKGVIVNADVNIRENCILNSGCIIEHDCFVDSFSHISVGTVLCGNVRIGKESFIGAGSTVIQGKRIGNNSIVGANSVVLTDVGDNMKVYGIVSKEH